MTTNHDEQSKWYTRIPPRVICENYHLELSKRNSSMYLSPKRAMFHRLTCNSIYFVALKFKILQKIKLQFLVASCLIKFWIGRRYVRTQQQRIKVPFIDTPITMSNFWQIIWHIMLRRRVCFISKIITFFRKIIFLCFEKVFLRFIIIHQI